MKIIITDAIAPVAISCFNCDFLTHCICDTMKNHTSLDNQYNHFNFALYKI